MSQLIVLDNEAVQALADPAHGKHNRVLSHVQVIADRKRRAQSIQIVVPTCVRVEAGWDRTAPGWAFANRLRIKDVPLDAAHADPAAAVRVQTAVSGVDAHLGAVIQLTSADQITVLTSDPADVRKTAGTRDITVITI
jgi:hypothetical protein